MTNITYQTIRNNSKEDKVLVINSTRLKMIVVGLLLIGILLTANLFIGKENKVSANSSSYRYYKSIQIQNGDTIWSIAEESITPEYESVQDYVDDILNFNNMINDKIYAGEYIVVPYYKH